MTLFIDHTDYEWNDWRWQLKHAARSFADLVRFGFIPSQLNSDHHQLTLRYKTLISPYYLSLIDAQNPNCPIRKQAIPNLQELKDVEGEISDPIGDKRYSPTPILVHRYPDRALLFPTFECPMYCRYCFRKESLNESTIRLHQALPQTLEYLRNHPQIKEIILSGGDPLLLSNEKLQRLILKILETGIKRIRIHSRMLVTLPQRINAELGQILSKHTLGIRLIIITHFNHPKELTHSSLKAIDLLNQMGISLLNQSVLLRGVNDRLDTLKTLSTQLIDHGVMPYYLHHPDLTKGTHHFRVSLDNGLQLYKRLRGQLSGYMIPRYMIEIPQGGGKVEVDSSAVKRGDKQGEWWLTSPLNGKQYRYVDLYP